MLRWSVVLVIFFFGCAEKKVEKVPHTKPKPALSVPLEVSLCRGELIPFRDPEGNCYTYCKDAGRGSLAYTPGACGK